MGLKPTVAAAASGTVSGVRTRRYHGLLVPATTPPAGRTVLVMGLKLGLRYPVRPFQFSSQRYGPDVLYPDGANKLVSFLFDLPVRPQRPKPDRRQKVGLNGPHNEAGSLSASSNDRGRPPTAKI